MGSKPAASPLLCAWAAPRGQHGCAPLPGPGTSPTRSGSSSPVLPIGTVSLAPMAGVVGHVGTGELPEARTRVGNQQEGDGETPGKVPSLDASQRHGRWEPNCPQPQPQSALPRARAWPEQEGAGTRLCAGQDVSSTALDPSPQPHKGVPCPFHCPTRAQPLQPVCAARSGLWGWHWRPPGAGAGWTWCSSGSWGGTGNPVLTIQPLRDFLPFLPSLPAPAPCSAQAPPWLAPPTPRPSRLPCAKASVDRVCGGRWAQPRQQRPVLPVPSLSPCPSFPRRRRVLARCAQGPQSSEQLC